VNDHAARSPIGTTVSARSLQDVAYHDLKRSIITLERAPGSRLPLDEVSEQLGVSHMPVRQAILRLAGEGFVDSIAHHGSRVRPLSFEDLEVIQSVREGIECRLTYLGAKSADPSVIAKLEEIIQSIAEDPAGTKDFDRLWILSAEFRDVLYGTADRPELLELCHTWRERLERYIRAGFDTSTNEQYVEMLESILDHCRSGRPDEAEAVTRASIRLTLDVWATWRDQADTSVPGPAPQPS